MLTVFDWSSELLDHGSRVGLPRFTLPRSAPLFPTESGGLLDQSYLLRRFHSYIDELGFASDLDIHSFWPSYATNLHIELGYDVSFVQYQLGHEHASTTSIYTIAAPDYRAWELHRVFSNTLTRSGALLPAPHGRKTE